MNPRKAWLISSIALAVTASVVTAVAAPRNPRPFDTPEQAVSALVDAAKANDQAKIVDILGASYRRWIVSNDPVADAEAVQRFVDAYQQKSAIERGGDNRAVLIVGNDNFPFPFPIVKKVAGWSFDPEAGKEELLNRRIGQNELDVIEVMRAVVDAQREYAARDRDDNGVPDYAMKFISAPGKRDGLYWPAAEGKPESPLGPLVGEATEHGYRGRDAAGAPKPYKGYYFRLLMRQGRDAPGGAYDYVIRGKMIGGFAVIAYPARYGVSGIKSFMVSQDGVVYEADLGRSTGVSVAQMTQFNPDRQWKKVSENH